MGALHKNTGYSVVVLENYAEKIDLPLVVKAISDYFDLAELREIVDKTCTSTLESLMNDPELVSSFTVDGLFYLRLIREELGYSFIDVIKRIIIVERIISVEKPSKIVVFEKRAFSSPTLTPLLGTIVKAIGMKHSIKVSTKRNPLSNAILGLKFFLTPLYFSLNSPLTKYNLWKARSFRNDTSEGIPQHVNGASRKAVFIPFTDAERVHLEPILEKLSNSIGFNCIAVQYPTDFRSVSYTYGKTRVHGCHFFKYSPKDSCLAKEKSEDLSRIWEKNKELFFACQALNITGVSLAELTRRMLDVDIKYWFKECVNYYVTTKEIIKVEQPDCVVASRERELFMRTVLAASRKERVPSVIVQHGIYYDSWLWDPIDATRLCIDEVFKEILIKRGENPEKIFVTGSPVYDKVLEEIIANGEIDWGQIGLVAGKKYICLLTSFAPEWLSNYTRINLLKSIIKFIESVDYDLIVRLHPRESKQEIWKLISSITKSECLDKRIHIISFEDANLFDVLKASDVVVGVRTSALVVAMLMEKPVILINFDKSVTDFFPDIEGQIFGVSESELELVELLKNIASDIKSNRRGVDESAKRGRKYALQYAPYNNATDRVVDCILQLIDRN